MGFHATCRNVLLFSLTMRFFLDRVALKRIKFTPTGWAAVYMPDSNDQKQHDPERQQLNLCISPLYLKTSWRLALRVSCLGCYQYLQNWITHVNVKPQVLAMEMLDGFNKFLVVYRF